MVRLRTILPPSSLVPGILLCLALPALPSPVSAAAKPAPPPAAKPAPPVDAKLKDRVLAVVDEDPILQSDLDRVIGLGLAQPGPKEDPAIFQRRVLDQLINERLRFHEMDRFGFEEVPVEDVDGQVAQIRARFKDEAAFQKSLRDQGMAVKDLRRVVARQLMVLAYVDEQLGSRVFVGLDDITGYYNTTFTADMKKRGEPVPPLDDVREDIRKVLREKRLNEAIAKWTDELRNKADVQVYLGKPPGAIPPVVKKVP